MVTINEELKAAKAAKAAIKVISGSRKSAVLTTLSKANHAAILNLGTGGVLNEARGNVGIALSSVLHSQPTPEKIDRAKSAIDTWMKELEAAEGSGGMSQLRKARVPSWRQQRCRFIERHP